MELTPECTDACCVANQNTKESRLPVEACSEHEILHGSESKYICESDICTSEASASDVSAQAEKRQDDDNAEVHGTSYESSYATSSTVLDKTRSDITCNKTNVQTQSAKPMEYRKTVVTARSQKNLSRLINQIQVLADNATDIYAMFKNTKKTANDMFQMALNRSYMSSKSEVVKVGGGRFCCLLLIGDVLLAAVESYDKKSAKATAFSIAVERLHMPYLCLEEKDDSVRLLGSNEPFVDMSVKYGDFKVNAYPGRGFGLDSSRSAADAEDNDVHEPLSARPYDAHLSKLVDYFHSLACRVKAVSKSALNVSSDMDLIQRAFAGNLVHMKTPFFAESGVGFYCKVSISGVEIACGHGSIRKQAKRAAYSAVVELMKKPYLCLQEVPQLNYSYKLIGSDRPFVGVTSGVLPCEQNCVVTDKGKIVEVKQSVKQGDGIDSRPWLTHDIGKLKLDACIVESSHSSQVASAVPEDLDETQVSAVTCGVRVSELVNQFRALANRVKSISKSSLVHNCTDIIDIALSNTQMQKKKLIAWLSSIACRCELSVDAVVLSYGAGDTKEKAKEAAYNDAFELLHKPHLQLQENLEFKRSYRLVGSDQPFVPLSHAPPTEHLEKFVATNKRPCPEEHPPGNLKMSKESTSCAAENVFCSQQRVETFPDQSLANFVILQNHFKKARFATMNIIQQSASFNKWPLSYDLTKVAEGCRCLLTLGGHTLANVVVQGKKTAKKAAAEQALKKLSSTCYTVEVKQYDIVACALTRNEVLQGSIKSDRIPSDNNASVPQLTPVTGGYDRAGLGFAQSVAFRPAVRHIMTKLVQSGGHDDLVFSPELTSEERDIVCTEARKNHLDFRCYSKGPAVEDIYVIVSLQQSPMELVNYLLQNGGENHKYCLLEPCKLWS